MNLKIKRASLLENLSSVLANIQGADRPVHLGSVISTFIVHLLKISYLNLLQAKFQFSSYPL